jgi:hypothetical protein
MTERKPPVISEKTPIGPDVDLDHENVRLAGGTRLTKTIAAEIVDEVHKSAAEPGGAEPELTPLRELMAGLGRELRELRLLERAWRALKHAWQAVESHSKVH